MTNEDDLNFVIRAFNFANEKHNGQLRKSGEPYINHCLAVTYELAKYQSDQSTLAAGFLHDTMEDCGVTYQELRSLFNEDVADIVQAVTKIKNLPDVSVEETTASTHRKLILAMAKDIRAVIVKLCDRLHNMRTLQFVSERKQQFISSETLMVYAPLAHRLGMNEIKNELENLCLFYLNPTEYGIVKDLIDNKFKETKLGVEELMEKIEGPLNDLHIQYRIFGRTKHIYSVYKKMYVKHTPFEKIFDLQAIRIVCQNKIQCYEILGLIHTIFKPVPGRFKDYIAMPKTNMYQSLHTTVLDEHGDLFEIQIRTEEMDSIAERGIAAHWIYKETNGTTSNQTQQLSEKQLSWLRDLIKINEESSETSDVEYMQQVQKDIFETSIFVLTPKGKIIDLAYGSTPVDFAYRVHSQVGNNCVGALVNKVMVPLNTELQSGDIVEIKTSNNSIGPSEDWLDFVKTNTARSQIKKAIAKRQSVEDQEEIQNQYLEKGKRLFEEYLKERFISKEEGYRQIDFLPNLQLFGVCSRNELFIAIGQRNLTASYVVNKMFEHNIASVEEQIDIINKRNYTVKKEKAKGDISVGNNSIGIKVETAVCCKPIPGDPIVGYITRGSGIKVHRQDCPNILNSDKRHIDVSWNQIVTDAIYPVDLEILSYDRHNLVIDLMGLLSSLNVRIDQISARSHYENKTATLSCTVYVNNRIALDVLVSKIKSLSGIMEVNRVSH